jgi:hypothetical protein
VLLWLEELIEKGITCMCEVKPVIFSLISFLNPCNTPMETNITAMDNAIPAVAIPTIGLEKDLRFCFNSFFATKYSKFIVQR